MKYEILFRLIYFLFGIIITFLITLKYNKEKILTLLKAIKDKVTRFIKNGINNSIIILILVIAYLIFDYLGYGTQALPEIIGTGASIFIINFFLEEREYGKNKDLKELLDYRMKRICDISNKMLLKYINFDEYDPININNELLINILKTQNLLMEKIKMSYIDDDGRINNEEIIKIDYPYFIAKELSPIVEQLTSNYGQYLDYNQITTLVELEEMLNRRIFKSRISLMGELEGQVPEEYIIGLAESLSKLNYIVSKLNIRG